MRRSLASVIVRNRASSFTIGCFGYRISILPSHISCHFFIVCCYLSDDFPIVVDYLADPFLVVDSKLFYAGVGSLLVHADSPLQILIAHVLTEAEEKEDAS